MLQFYIGADIQDIISFPVSQLLSSDVGAIAGTLLNRARHSTMYPKFAFRVYFLIKMSYSISKMNFPPSPLKTKQNKTESNQGLMLTSSLYFLKSKYYKEPCGGNSALC